MITSNARGYVVKLASRVHFTLRKPCGGTVTIIPNLSHSSGNHSLLQVHPKKTTLRRKKHYAKCSLKHYLHMDTLGLLTEEVQTRHAIEIYNDI